MCIFATISVFVLFIALFLVMAIGAGVKAYRKVVRRSLARICIVSSSLGVLLCIVVEIFAFMFILPR